MPRIDSTKTNLTGADLTQHVNGKAAYKGVDFTYMYCVRVNFSGLDLTGCNFTGAELTGATFTDATLDGANFTDAFIRVPGEKEETFPLVPLEQLQQAKSLKGTILPDGRLADAPAKEPAPTVEDYEAKMQAMQAEFEAKLQQQKEQLEAEYRQAVEPKPPEPPPRRR